MIPHHAFPGVIDVLIIGAGTAGCVLANRLSADRARSVVLLEAGGEDADPRIHEPQRWPALLGSEFDWAYSTAPQAALDGRCLPCPRGKVLGGSSAINAMGHQRGHSSVFDAWEAAGSSGWSFASMLPWFKRSEDFAGGADTYRGVGGPIGVVRAERGQRNPVAACYLRAVSDHGFGFTEDLNGACMTGGAWNQFAIRDGVRQSTAHCYLAPVRHRPNLRVITGTVALRLAIAGGRCVGVHTHDGAGPRLIRAERVVLSAGAIDSPRLLMLSGIGPADALRRHGIMPLVDLPGVGCNLHDHALAGLVYRPKREIPLSRYNHGEAVLFCASDAGRDATDLLVMCVTTKQFSTPKTGPVPEDGYSIVPAMMAPQSRGSVTLTSAGPRAPARIDPGYLREAADISRFVRGVELARALGASPALAEWRYEEVLPGPERRTRDELASFVRNATTSFHHPVGTCRMGTDAHAVVDPRLQVRGLDGLSVVDASVMPLIPNAMPHAATIALAERAAFLLGAAVQPVAWGGAQA